MKSQNNFSSSSFNNSDESNINQNDNINLDIKESNNLSKDIELNNSINKNENEITSFQYTSDNNKINQEKLEQSESNNFNLTFFLPKELRENIEIEEENINLNELDCKEEDCNYYQINDFNNDNDNDVNQLNNYNNEYINIENNKKIFQNLNNYMNDNNGFINKIDENKKEQLNDNFIFNNNNDINDSNNHYNLNKNIYENYNLSGLYNDFNFPPISLNKKEDQINNAQFNNDNNSNNNITPMNQNKISENQFINNNIFLNNNNFLNPINQINFNMNQMQPNLNDLSLFTFQNKLNPNFDINQNEPKKSTKKIIDDYTIEMFGRRGWICELCNNFNYETRKKCNRCRINKKPKKIINYLLSGKNKIINHKNDWYCPNCGNFNYSFRIICNRCHMKKKDEINL